MPSESLRQLLKTQTTHSYSKVSAASHLGRVPRICISDGFADDVSAAGPGTAGVEPVLLFRGVC